MHLVLLFFMGRDVNLNVQECHMILPGPSLSPQIHDDLGVIVSHVMSKSRQCRQ